MYYEDPFDANIDLFYLKRLPQFAGMSEEDLRILFRRILAIEERQYEQEAIRKRLKERADDAEYLESHPNDPVISTNPIKMERGVFFDSKVLDDRSFLSDDALSKLPRRTKWSLDEKKKMYHNWPF